MQILISLSKNLFEPLTYNFNRDSDDIKPGVRVVVPVGNRLTTGWVVEGSSAYQGKVKNVIGIIQDDYLPDYQYLNFAKCISGIYLCSVGLILDYSLPPKKKSINGLYFKKDDKIERLSKYSLREIQKLSSGEMIPFFYKSKKNDIKETRNTELQNLKEGEKTFLIGYQRGDFYKDVIDDCLKGNRSVLITVPDGLTAKYLKSVFKNIDIYNSEVKVNDREQLWKNYSEGKAGIVAGGLSASMLPIKNLGCIISERAGSFLSRGGGYSEFSVNLISRARAEVNKVPLIEGYSTFTSESFKNRSQITIEDRREGSIQAEVRMLGKKVRGIPGELIELIKSYYLDNKKILIILNRKKTSHFLFCDKCKRIQSCPVCRGMLRVEKEFDVLCMRCHFKDNFFDRCSSCKEPLFVQEDISLISLEEAIGRWVVETGVLTVSSDDVKDINIVLKKIEKSRVVISTPVILNPFFRDIFDSIIYIRPESIFNINKYNAAEMIFLMVSELRELVKKSGTHSPSIDIFSTFHFHYSLRLINEEERFFERELKYREWFLLPPFSNVYTIEVRDGELRKLGTVMRQIYENFKDLLNIKNIYIISRKKVRGSYKGAMEAHSSSESILESGLLKKRNIKINLVSI